jgi:DNA (cytosine-5)-methyltransferase 1
MKYLSVCAGIEAATVAWHPLNWEPAAFSEIDAFPSAVLAHHYPNVPNWGDMTQFKTWPDADLDLLVGGTPCQSFSVAGLRKGLDDPRGNLMLTYLAIAERYQPQWLVWENVPGVLSSNGGRDFGAFLGALGQLGYGFAYRVLDAQFFGVAQRRRRVFVVGHAGDWRRAAAVLFERESLSGHPAPSQEKRQSLTRGAEIGPSDGRYTEVAPTMDTRAKDGPMRNQVGACVMQGVRMTAFGEYVEDGTASAMKARDYKDATDLVVQPVAFPANLSATQHASAENIAPSMGAKNPTAVMAHSAVRRLTPVECERLQGFPDGYTAIPYQGKPADACPDSPRYKALGNSMAVPVMAWIGRRIQLVHDL